MLTLFLNSTLDHNSDPDLVHACRLSDPNVVSWGQIIGSNRPYILDAGFTVTIPGLAIFVTVLSISLIGDGLNDALNPKLRAR